MNFFDFIIGYLDYSSEVLFQDSTMLTIVSAKNVL